MMDVAAGRLDAYFEDGFGGPWDVAAGKVIIEEAGGVVRGLSCAQLLLFSPLYNPGMCLLSHVKPSYSYIGWQMC